MKLLTRDQFRDTVLRRNEGLCCVPECRQLAVDAHHILNRNLFTVKNEFGGYFFDNGAQLCSQHHYDSELTFITVEELVQWCGIKKRVTPATMDDKQTYDCWGNTVSTDGMRTPGPLFDDEGCQNALRKASMLWRFNKY